MFEPRLKRITLKRYKSIENGEIDLSDISILIGRNNSGKSNVIDAFSTLQEIEEIRSSDTFTKEWLRQRTIRKQSSDGFELAIIYHFPSNYRNEIEASLSSRKRSQRDLKSQIESGDALTEIKYKWEITGTGRNDREYTFYVDGKNGWETIKNIARTSNNFDRSAIREDIQASIESWRFVEPFRVPRDIGPAGYVDELKPDGSNLVAVLQSLQTNHPDIFEEIASAYVDIMDGVSNISVQYDTDRGEARDMTVIVEEEAYDIGFKSEDISSGSKEILVLLTQIYLAARDADVLFLEEPELHLHPGAEQEVFNIIQDLVDSAGLQVVISTHSDVFVNQAEASSITRVDRDGHTDLRSINPEDVDVELQDLGYEKSGLLQAEAVVFVEGLSDKRILRQFAKTAGLYLDEAGVELVELEGIDNMKADAKSLVKLLHAFGIPYLFVIDRHDSTVEEARGELYESMTRSDGNEWWEASTDNIFVWDAYGVEQYLLNARAIAADFDMAEEKVQILIENHEDADDKEEVLRQIYAEEYSDHTNPEEIYEKTKHGMDIAKRMEPNELPDEVQRALLEIVGLVDGIEPTDLDVSFEKR